MRKLKQLVLLSVILLIGCTNSYCPPEEAKIAFEELSLIQERWLDGIQIANATPRMSLPTVIENLQIIKRDANALDVPECLIEAQKYLVESMEYGIDSFLSFLSNDEDGMVNFNFNISNSLLSSASVELKEINACLPNCRPTAIPSPTSTPLPTQTPTPTLSPTPTLTPLPIILIVEIGDCPNKIEYVESDPKTVGCIFDRSEVIRDDPNKGIGYVEVGGLNPDSSLNLYCAIFNPDGKLLDAQIDTDRDGKVICNPKNK